MEAEDPRAAASMCVGHMACLVSLSLSVLGRQTRAIIPASATGLLRISDELSGG